jgi:large subunit ribosomal protein L13
MKTHVTKPSDIERKWYLIDANDQVLGRLSTKVADILRGKNKPNFSPHLDCGDYVVIINTEKVRLTGNKVEDKRYYRHSGYPGGIKEETVGDKLAKNPNGIIYHAVKGMLPKNKLSDEIIKKLKLFAGGEHDHEAQKPERIEIG